MFIKISHLLIRQVWNRRLQRKLLISQSMFSRKYLNSKKNRNYTLVRHGVIPNFNSVHVWFPVNNRKQVYIHLMSFTSPMFWPYLEEDPKCIKELTKIIWEILIGFLHIYNPLPSKIWWIFIDWQLISTQIVWSTAEVIQFHNPAWTSAYLW